MRRLLVGVLVVAGVAVCALLASDGGARSADLMQEDARLRAVKVCKGV